MHTSKQNLFYLHYKLNQLIQPTEHIQIQN